MTDDLAKIPSLTDLDDDCLHRILLYVPAADRIKLRRVCKRFREASDDCWRTVRELTIMDRTMIPGFGSDYGTDIVRTKEEVYELERGFSGLNNDIWLRTSNQRLIEGVLKRCGEFITTLRDYRESKTNSALPLAIKHCHKLDKLLMSVTSKAQDKQLNQLLAVNKKLRILNLETCFKNIKVCFRTIPTEFLEELRIDSYGMRPPPSILMNQKQIVSKAHSLKNLDFNTLDDELVELIGKKIKLEVLKLETLNADYLTETGFTPLLHLKNLRELTLMSPALCGPDCTHHVRAPVDDDFLTTLAENFLLLEELTLETPAFVTDKGFAKLASLPKLRHLTIVSCKGITDQFLILFDKIEILGLIECNIHDEGVIKFLEKSQTVRQLNLERSYITNNSLVAAVQATKKRENGRRLIFFVTHTNTAPNEFTEGSPLLEIVRRKRTGTRLHKS